MLQWTPAKLVRSFQVKIKLLFISLVRFNLTKKLKVNPNVRNKFGFINGRNLIAIGNFDIVGWLNQTDQRLFSLTSGFTFTTSQKSDLKNAGTYSRSLKIT